MRMMADICCYSTQTCTQLLAPHSPHSATARLLRQYFELTASVEWVCPASTGTCCTLCVMLLRVVSLAGKPLPHPEHVVQQRSNVAIHLRQRPQQWKDHSKQLAVLRCTMEWQAGQPVAGLRKEAEQTVVDQHHTPHITAQHL